MQPNSLEYDLPIYGSFCSHYMHLKGLNGEVQIHIAPVDPHEND